MAVALLLRVNAVPDSNVSAVFNNLTRTCITSENSDILSTVCILYRHIAGKTAKSKQPSYETWLKANVLQFFFSSQKEIKQHKKYIRFVLKTFTEMIYSDTAYFLQIHMQLLQSSVSPEKTGAADYISKVKQRLIELGENTDKFSVPSASSNKSQEWTATDIVNLLDEYDKAGKIPEHLHKIKLLRKTWWLNSFVPLLLTFDAEKIPAAKNQGFFDLVSKYKDLKKKLLIELIKDNHIPKAIVEKHSTLVDKIKNEHTLPKTPLESGQKNPFEANHLTNLYSLGKALELLIQKIPYCSPKEYLSIFQPISHKVCDLDEVFTTRRSDPKHARFDASLLSSFTETVLKVFYEIEKLDLKRASEGRIPAAVEISWQYYYATLVVAPFSNLHSHLHDALANIACNYIDNKSTNNLRPFCFIVLLSNLCTVSLKTRDISREMMSIVENIFLGSSFLGFEAVERYLKLLFTFLYNCYTKFQYTILYPSTENNAPTNDKDIGVVIPISLFKRLRYLMDRFRQVQYTNSKRERIQAILQEFESLKKDAKEQLKVIDAVDNVPLYTWVEYECWMDDEPTVKDYQTQYLVRDYLPACNGSLHLLCQQVFNSTLRNYFNIGDRKHGAGNLFFVMTSLLSDCDFTNTTVLPCWMIDSLQTNLLDVEEEAVIIEQIPHGRKRVVDRCFSDMRMNMYNTCLLLTGGVPLSMLDISTAIQIVERFAYRIINKLNNLYPLPESTVQFLALLLLKFITSVQTHLNDQSLNVCVKNFMERTQLFMGSVVRYWSALREDFVRPPALKSLNEVSPFQEMVDFLDSMEDFLGFLFQKKRTKYLMILSILVSDKPFLTGCALADAVLHFISASPEPLHASLNFSDSRSHSWSRFFDVSEYPEKKMRFQFIHSRVSECLEHAKHIIDQSTTQTSTIRKEEVLNSYKFSLSFFQSIIYASIFKTIQSANANFNRMMSTYISHFGPTVSQVDLHTYVDNVNTLIFDCIASSPETMLVFCFMLTYAIEISRVLEHACFKSPVVLKHLMTIRELQQRMASTEHPFFEALQHNAQMFRLSISEHLRPNDGESHPATHSIWPFILISFFNILSSVPTEWMQENLVEQSSESAEAFTPKAAWRILFAACYDLIKELIAIFPYGEDMPLNLRDTPFSPTHSNSVATPRKVLQETEYPVVPVSSYENFLTLRLNFAFSEFSKPHEKVIKAMATKNT